MTDHIIDAFGDFLDDYQVLIPLVHELFLTLNQEIERIKLSVIDKVKDVLKLPEGTKIDHLETKFQSIF